MKIKYSLLLLLGIILTLASCKSDDDVFVPGEDERDRAEQQVADKDTLLTYLSEHYYNSTEIANNPSPTIDDLVITKLAEGETQAPTDHTLLADAVESKTTEFLDVSYESYVLRINQGWGEAPTFVDKIRLNYEGTLLDGEIFDSTATPADLDLVDLIPGWNRVIPQFNAADSFVENNDGTVTYNNPGLGVMFLPSGLAYFSSGPNSISPYSCLVFKFELYQTERNDHDADGLPSFYEDLNTNLDLFDEDTDGDTIPNYLDFDDDGDGVLTRDELVPNEYVINDGDPDPLFGAKEFEISRSEENGMITINTVTIVDADNNNVDDYLDEAVTTNYNEG